MGLKRVKKGVEIDKKVGFCRIMSLPMGFHYERDYWGELKDCVNKSQDIDWSQFVSQFAMTTLLCHETNFPHSVENHMAIKSLFAFFQQGYLVGQGDQENEVGLFYRSSEKNRITRGGSVLVSGRSTSLADHDAGISKICSKLNVCRSDLEIKPWCVGFTELSRDGAQFSPAYFWLINKVNPLCKLPSKKALSRSGDCFLGMKNKQNLLKNKVTVNGDPVAIQGKFDRLVIELINSNSKSLNHGHSSIRQLNHDEVKSISDTKFFENEVFFDPKSGLLKTIALIATTATTVSAGISQVSDLSQVLDQISKFIQ